MEVAERPVEEISVSQVCLTTGGRIAEGRVIKAGYRLEAVLKRIAAD